MAGLRFRSFRLRLRDRRLLRLCWQGWRRQRLLPAMGWLRWLFRQRLAHSGKWSGSRFWPPSNRLVGTEARQRKSWESHPPPSIAACVITISNEEDKPQICAEKPRLRNQQAFPDPRFFCVNLRLILTFSDRSCRDRLWGANSRT